MSSFKFDAILFDFDGVLADTELLHFDCWRDALIQAFSIHLDPGRQTEFIGVADRAMINQIAADQGRPAAELWTAYARKQALFRERVALESPIHSGAVELLKSIHFDYKLAVVSSSDRSEIEPPLVHAGVRPLFQALVCGNEVLNLKPAPDPYLRAAGLLEIRRPLVVEDSDAGLASGLAAGFEVLRVSSSAAMPEELRAYLKESQLADGRSA